MFSYLYQLDPSARTIGISHREFAATHLDSMMLKGSNNLTTLENITHTFPAALIAQADRKDRSSSAREWKPEHLLTRKERVKLREEAREINVFDLGWRHNVHDILIGERAGWWTIAVPWMRPRR